MDPKKIVLVLWGEGCDESLAVNWVSRLRAQGRRVYLVGVSGRGTRGQYGVVVEPDVGLDDGLELVGRAGLVILPCGVEVVQRLRDDPRFDTLLLLAGQTGARFLVHPSAQKTIAEMTPEAEVAELNWDTKGNER